MKYTIKNLISLIRTEKIIFVLMLLCVISSSVVINFSYGLYGNYQREKIESESAAKTIEMETVDSTAVTKDKLKECALSLSDGTNNDIEMYYLTPIIEPFYSGREIGWGTMAVCFSVKGGQITVCDLFKNNLEKNGTIYKGEYFTHIQETQGAFVAIAGDDFGDIDSCSEAITSRTENGTVYFEIQGKEYEVIALHKMGNTPFVPFESLDDDTQFDGEIYLGFESSFTRSEYNEVREVFESAFGDAIIVPEPDITDAGDIYLYNTIIIIAVLIAVLSAVNFAVLYKYILEKRQKSIAIFAICGCRKMKAFTIFLSECVIMSLPIYIISAICYDKLILPRVGEYLDYINEVYSVRAYAVIFLIWAVSTVLVLCIMLARAFFGKTLYQSAVNGG